MHASLGDSEPGRVSAGVQRGLLWLPNNFPEDAVCTGCWFACWLVGCLWARQRLGTLDSVGPELKSAGNPTLHLDSFANQFELPTIPQARGREVPSSLRTLVQLRDHEGRR